MCDTVSSYIYMKHFLPARFSAYAPLILRLGLGAVVLWFGVNQLLSPESWAIWVPAWTAFFGLAPVTVVYLNGIFEVFFSSLLTLGFFIRPVAFLLFLHLLVIVIDIGIDPIGVRDFGLAAGFLALSLWESPGERA